MGQSSPCFGIRHKDVALFYAEKFQTGGIETDAGAHGGIEGLPQMGNAYVQCKGLCLGAGEFLRRFHTEGGDVLSAAAAADQQQREEQQKQNTEPQKQAFVFAFIVHKIPLYERPVSATALVTTP